MVKLIEMQTLNLDNQEISKANVATQRRNHKHILSQGTMRIIQVMGQPTITIAVFTIILPMKIVKKQAEMEMLAGWKIDFHKTTVATTTQEIPILTEVFKSVTKMLVEIPSTFLLRRYSNP